MWAFIPTPTLSQCWGSAQPTCTSQKPPQIRLAGNTKARPTARVFFFFHFSIKEVKHGKKISLYPGCGWIKTCKDSSVWQTEKERNVSHSNNLPCWFFLVLDSYSHFPLFLSLIRQSCTLGLSGILNQVPHSCLYCVSWATAFPFSVWQYPSFLFISHLWGRRKWITGLSRRSAGAITVAQSKRNFDIWGLLAFFYSWGALGVCYGTSHW